MTFSYGDLNMVLGLLALAITMIRLKDKDDIMLAIKTGLVVLFLGFPWDFFGIQLRAWDHGDPGPAFLNVPLHEMLLSFLMSYIAAMVLLWNFDAILEEARSYANSKQSR